MAYVIYHKDTTILLGGYGKRYATVRAAKSGLTRALKSGVVENRQYFDIAELQDFHANIEKQVERTNLMSDEKYMEPINTPPHLSPAFERYWSM